MINEQYKLLGRKVADLRQEDDFYPTPAYVTQALLDNYRFTGEIWEPACGDGRMSKTGYDIEVTRAVSSAVRIPVIASGGAGNLDHMVDVLVEGKADAVLAASIFHFGEYTVPEAKAYFASRGIPVRPLAE